jgi:hypothetical protein
MRNSEPIPFRLRLSDVATPGAVLLKLPARTMWPIGLVVAAMFAVFAGVEWTVIRKISSHSPTDLFDLMFLLFEGFWVLGWSVGVVIIGSLAVLLLFYGESARLQNNTLIHVPRFGPLKVLLDYDLSRVRNLRLEDAGSEHAVRLRFDYNGRPKGLGDTMPRAAAQELLDTIRSAAGPAASDDSTPPIVVERTPEASTISTAPTAADEQAASASGSGLALVAANLLPLAGVLFFHWDLSSVMLLFWAESGVIAFYTVLKMAFVGRFMAMFAIPFFVGHFGGFMAAHFLLIYMLFLHTSGSTPEPAIRDTLGVIFTPLWTSIAALFISHGMSFASNFVGRREYAGTTMAVLMSAPYNRIMVMQLVLIFGGWIILLTKSPMPALVLLVSVKTALDYAAHVKERKRFAAGHDARPI